MSGARLAQSLVILCFALLLFLTQPAFTLAGFGVSPPAINQENAVPGSQFNNIIYLVQGNPDRDVDVTVTVESRDMKDWITFENGTAFTIPQGVQQYPLTVQFNVPEDAELGVYTAFIRVATNPAKNAANDGEVAIALGGRIDTTITVGDNVVSEFEIAAINILDIQSGDPLQASVRINNTGNVPAAPYAASFELFDKFGNTRLAFINATEEQFPRVPSFSEESVTLSFPVDLVVAPGEYWGHVKIYNEKGNILRDLNTVFNVTEGSVQPLEELPALATLAGSVSPLLVGGAAALLVIIIGGVLLSRGKRREKRSKTDQPKASTARQNKKKKTTATPRRKKPKKHV